jgi:HSP20 family protein
MANITRRGEAPPALTPRGELDPFRMMRELLRWDPFGEMAPSRIPLFEGRGAFVPAFEVKEMAHEYLFKADLPGVRQDDLDISVTGNRLTVSGHRDAEERDEHATYYAFERSYGTFTRSFTLPEGVDPDRVRADLKDGVLTLIVPKRPEAQPRKINLKAEKHKA